MRLVQEKVYLISKRKNSSRANPAEKKNRRSSDEGKPVERGRVNPGCPCTRKNETTERREGKDLTFSEKRKKKENPGLLKKTIAVYRGGKGQ